MSRTGLTEEQAQRVLDYVADRLSGTDNAIAEPLLDGFVAQLRQLSDIAKVKRLIEQGDDEALKPFGGLEGAKGMVLLVETIGGA